MKIRVISRFRVTGSSNLDTETDQLHAALLAQERLDARLTNADVTVILTQQLVSISVVVEAASWDEAGEVGSGMIVRAIEGVGGRVMAPEVTTEGPDLPSPVVRASSAHLEARIQSTQLVPA